jgi:hypothetical protein
MCLYRGEIAEGPQPDPFTSEDAERCCALIDDELLVVDAVPDAELAALMNVPDDQIAKRRQELATYTGASLPAASTRRADLGVVPEHVVHPGLLGG